VVDGGGPYTGTEGSSITFDASTSYDPDGSMTFYEWDFTGDAEYDVSSNEPTASWTWLDDYLGNVRLRITDDVGLTATTTAEVTVLNVAPTANAGADQIVDEGSVVFFSGSFTDPGTADTHTIEWDFGDGTMASDTLSPSHVYADDGIYTVTLWVTDDDMGVSSDTLTVTVNNVAPTVALTGAEAAEEGSVYNLTLGAVTDPGDDTVTQFIVHWGDGATRTYSSDGDVTHTYADGPANHTIIVDLVDEDGLHEAAGTLTVQVNNVVPSVTADNPTITVDEGQTATNTGTFDDPGDDVVTLSAWVGTIVDDGDGAWSWSFETTDGPNQSQTVTITATDSDGAISTTTFDLDVRNVAPSVTADNPTITVDEGQTATNTGTFDDPGDDVVTLSASIGTITDNGDGTWSWSFDAADGPDQNQTVTLVATDSDGASTSTTFELVVHNVAPTAMIQSMAQPNAMIVLPVVHTLTLTGSFTDPGWLDTHTVSWDFGDGTIEDGTVSEENQQPDATGQSVVDHVYSQPGTYAVTMTVVDDDGGVGTSQAWVVEVLTAQQATEALDQYIQELPEEAFDKNEEQRKNALHNKLKATIQLIEAGEYDCAINKLVHDIRAKADGSADGNSKNDWIVDPLVQLDICLIVDDLIAYLLILAG